MMTTSERELIRDLKKCNFKEMAEYFKLKSEERKNRSKEEKKVKFSVCGIKININIIYKSFNKTFLQKI